MAASTLVQRVRALQGGLPFDEAAVAARREDIAAGTAITGDNLAERLSEVRKRRSCFRSVDSSRRIRTRRQWLQRGCPVLLVARGLPSRQTAPACDSFASAACSDSRF